MDYSVNVVWLSYHKPEIKDRGYWDQGILEDMFKLGNFKHYTIEDYYDAIPDDEGVVVIINGRTHTSEEDIRNINTNIERFAWVVFIVTGDEEALFPLDQIRHPMLRTWVQLPRMNKHNDVSYKLPNGYRPETRDTLKEIGLQERSLDWSFVGQVNHERRQQCVDVLNQFAPIYPNSYIAGTDGFGKEAVQYKEYLEIMAKSKIVLCPSGIETPDSFRLYEALEAGCIPVVDAFSTNFKTPGFWQYLFGSDIPFPIINYWDDLPQLLPTLLKEYPANANKIFAWWQQKKRSMYIKLKKDIEVLHG